MSSPVTKEWFVTAPGGRVFIKKWVPENLRHTVPVIMLHDSLGCTGLWRAFPALLATHLGREVYAYDRLGYGKSDSVTAMPAPDFISREAELTFPAVKEAINPESYILFGHSTGGSMALVIAADDPECDAVITEGTQAYVEERTLNGIRAAMEEFKKPEQMEKLSKWHGAKADWVLRAWTDTWLSPEFAQWSLSHLKGKISSPVLALHGVNDEFGSVAVPEFIAQQLSTNGSMLLLKNCGHSPHKEKQDDVLSAVLSFLADHSVY